MKLFQKIQRCPKCFQLISHKNFYQKNLYLAENFYFVEVHGKSTRVLGCLHCLEIFLKTVTHEETTFQHRRIITFKPPFGQRLKASFFQWGKKRRKTDQTKQAKEIV